MSAFGSLLRYWRGARKMSQLAVAMEAEVSTRHLSFIETGKSNPSRDMVLLLADVLEVPLRERNALLQAAGFASMYRETALDSPELGPVRQSIEFMLEHHNPYPAVLMDRHWTILMQNQSSLALLSMFIADPSILVPPLNVMRVLFDPRGFRPFILNWDELASAMIQRLHAEAALAGDQALHGLVEELLGMEGVPSSWRSPDYTGGHPMMVTTHVRRDDIELNLFSAITTLGTPLDITLQELRLETFFPADQQTDDTIRKLTATAIQ